ncbi:MAG: hypothetical protein SO179_04275 [Bacteroidales bacterium]|nr:hypothetical protein [Bacteroidales bacterium]
MNKKNKEKETFTFSSIWFKKNKGIYLFLLFDIFFLLILAIFSFKEYLIGNFDKNLPYDGLMFLILMFILFVFRFNLTLLVFAKQRLGIPIAIIFLLIVIYAETKYVDATSPFLLIFDSLILFFNKFLFVIPKGISRIITYILYLYLFYTPIIIYAFYIIFNVKLNNKAKAFDVFSGFYASTLSKKLRIMDIIVISFFMAISMWIGLISINKYWAFLAVPISMYSIYEFCKRLELNKMINSKCKLVIYLVAATLLTALIYSQRFPYWGINIFILSFFIMYFIFYHITKSHFKSSIIVGISFIIIPSLSLGYNIFAYPQYGVVANSIPFEDEKKFLIIKDREGNYGIRNRSYKIVKPKYKKIEYNSKNIVMMLNQNNQWETYDLENSKFIYKNYHKNKITYE